MGLPLDQVKCGRELLSVSDDYIGALTLPNLSWSNAGHQEWVSQ